MNQQTETIIFYRDGKEFNRLEKQTDRMSLYKVMHKVQSQSVDWAVMYEGYKIEFVDDSNGLIEVYKPFRPTRK